MMFLKSIYTDEGKTSIWSGLRCGESFYPGVPLQSLTPADQAGLAAGVDEGRSR